MNESDLGPMPAVVRARAHELEPGMLVRPRGADGQKLDGHRWVVGRIAGAFTLAHRGLGKLQYREQYWATDTLVPVRRKGSKEPMRVTDLRRRKARPVALPKPIVKQQAQDAKGKPTETPKPPKRTGPRPPDNIAGLLKDCHNLEALIAAALSVGYPDCDALRSRISHLSNGLQRMNVGNRLRSFLSGVALGTAPAATPGAGQA